MNRNLFLLLLFLQLTFLQKLESKAESNFQHVSDSTLVEIRNITLNKQVPVEPVQIIVRDTIEIKAKALPQYLYKIKETSDSSNQYFNFSIKTITHKDPLKHIDNLGFKYLLGELEVEAKEKEDKSVDKAVNSLLDYVKNDSIRTMVNYLKNYIEKRKTEDALRKLAKKVAYEDRQIQEIDSLSEEDLVGLKDDVRRYSDLYNYVENDDVHQWIREISRDSVSFAVKNGMNDSLAFWINNGKTDFKRFWLKKSKRDSIGIWVQNTRGKSIRILYDDDVYQESVKNQKRRGAKVRLKERLSPDGFKLAKLKKYRRYVDIWKLGSIIKLDFNQGHVSKGWAEGGESSISALSGIRSFAKYKRNKTTWETTVDMQYGLIKSGENEFRKNQDKFELNTKFGQLAFKKWYYTSMFNLKTQFVKGYKYNADGSRELISDFFAPAYIIASIGLDYKPKKDFSILLSPFTAKYTIVSDTKNIDATAFGIDTDKSVKKEIGSYVKLLHKWKITKDISVENKVEFYSSYTNKPKNIDIDWQFILNLPINQYLTTTVSTYFISDDDTGSKVQFKENLAIGVRYQF